MFSLILEIRNHSYIICDRLFCYHSVKNILRYETAFRVFYRPSVHLFYLEQVIFLLDSSALLCRRNYAEKKMAESVDAHYKSYQIFLAYISSV